MRWLGGNVLDAGDLARATGLVARVRRLESTFKKWRRMPDWHEAEAARRELREIGFDIPPGDGWDGPPVAT